jgi:hypothetical protein
MQVGDFVHYKGDNYTVPENGRIKSLMHQGDILFVVYKCNGEWDRYNEYTGQATNSYNLKPGWVDKDGNPIDTPKTE